MLYFKLDNVGAAFQGNIYEVTVGKGECHFVGKLFITGKFLSRLVLQNLYILNKDDAPS